MPHLLHSAEMGLLKSTSKISDKARNNPKSPSLQILWLPVLFSPIISLQKHLQLLTGKDSHSSCPPIISPFAEDYPNLPAELLLRLLPNPCLAEPDKSAEVITAE